MTVCLLKVVTIVDCSTFRLVIVDRDEIDGLNEAIKSYATTSLPGVKQLPNLNNLFVRECRVLAKELL
jgi:hypothetical protein